MTALVSGRLEGLEAVDEAVPGHRVATDTDTGGDTDVLLLQLVQRLVGQGAGAATMPTGPPALAMWPAVMPMLLFPGEMMPGQFGPSSWCREVGLQLVVEVGLVVGGTPSVMATMNSIPASAASSTAD